MDGRIRASSEQLSTMLVYMEGHGDLAKPLPGLQGRIMSDRLWTDLTNVLNAVGGGVNKTVDKWKKVWADCKSKTKKKALTLRRHPSGTGDGSAKQQTLSSFDKRVLAVMGHLAVEDQASVEMLDVSLMSVYHSELKKIENYMRSGATVYNPSTSWFHEMHSFLGDTGEYRESISSELISKSSGTSQLSPPVAQDNDPLEILDEKPVLRMSPPPSIPQPSSSRLLPSASTTQTPPVNPPRRRRLPFPHSPRRPQMRVRRRRALTSFEKAESEFAAVELRRLELEQTRSRQQHEREMIALKLEQERIQVFSSLVNIAQDWFDYYRSRNNTTDQKWN